jgi:hypothetical protein
MRLPEWPAHAPARRVLPLLALFPLTFCAGCGTTRTTGVEQRMILPEGAARYEMETNQAFVCPVPQDNATPAFPDGFGKQDLAPTTLCASFVVNSDGTLRDVALLEEAGCTSAAAQPLLGAAVLEAVSGWRFDPAMFCIYPDAATRDRDWNGDGCAGAVAEAKPVAVTLAYAFTFEVRNGRQRVDAARSTAGR